MTHQPDAPATSAVLRHARRALLVVGGAFVWWLVFLSGGSAQADAHATQPGQTAAGSTVRAASGTTQDAATKVDKAELTDTVDRAASTLTDTLRATPHTLTSTIRSSTAHMPEPVGTTVVRLTDALEPTLTTTTTAVADTVDRTVDAIEPVVDPILQTIDPTAPETATALAPAAGQTTDRAPASSRYDPVRAAVTAAADGPSTRTPAERPLQHREPAVPTPSAPGAPAPTTTGGASQGAAVLTVGALVSPATRRRRRGRRDDSLPTGPVFGPDSSPD